MVKDKSPGTMQVSTIWCDKSAKELPCFRVESLHGVVEAITNVEKVAPEALVLIFLIMHFITLIKTYFK
ncbi:hypothetical protein BCM0060_p2154 (plasmid) [Bacillus cereus]|nr:hypothetical protein BCM0060_p2154 [Bacillus cereus]BCC16475.1 hypothetical protein BCM0075_1245 [Bacillus cereus]BCD08920.1 hypothetical protein BC30052_p2202 [Bacillus cereus]